MQSLTRCDEARVDSLLLTLFFFPPLSLPLKNSNFKMKKFFFRVEREKKKSMSRVRTIPYIFISFDEILFHNATYVCGSILPIVEESEEIYAQLEVIVVRYTIFHNHNLMISYWLRIRR